MHRNKLGRRWGKALWGSARWAALSGGQRGLCPRRVSDRLGAAQPQPLGKKVSFPVPAPGEEGIKVWEKG